MIDDVGLSPAKNPFLYTFLTALTKDAHGGDFSNPTNGEYDPKAVKTKNFDDNPPQAPVSINLSQPIYKTKTQSHNECIMYMVIHLNKANTLYYGDSHRPTGVIVQYFIGDVEYLATIPNHPGDCISSVV